MNILEKSTLDRALRRLAEGDLNALTVIYDKMGRRIYLLSLSILRDHNTAQDILQEVLLKLSSGGASGYTPDTNPVAFLLTMTRNMSLTSLKKRSRELPTEELPDSPVYDDDESMQALPVLATLDATERQIVLLHIEFGMKHRDIAAVVGLSVSACEKRYGRAAAKMREYYRDKKVVKGEYYESQKELPSRS